MYPLHQPKVKLIMPYSSDTAGLAALSICESLLFALRDQSILSGKEVTGLLKDAAATHECAPDDDEGGRHARVAALINGILAKDTSDQ